MKNSRSFEMAKLFFAWLDRPIKRIKIPKKQNKNGPKDCIEFNININAPSGEHSDKPGSGQGQDKKTLFVHLLLLNYERNSYPV